MTNRDSPRDRHTADQLLPEGEKVKQYKEKLAHVRAAKTTHHYKCTACGRVIGELKDGWLYSRHGKPRDRRGDVPREPEWERYFPVRGAVIGCACGVMNYVGAPGE